jgi:replicative DNA helicase
MTALSPDVSAALASLQARWGAAAPRVVGALATAPLPEEQEAPAAEPRTGVERIVRTGFPALDAILGPGGVPRSASVALRGDASSGKTTLALRLVAEAQADGRDRRLAGPRPGPGPGRRPPPAASGSTGSSS